MKRIITMAVMGLAALALATPVLAAEPPPPQPVTPFPTANAGDVFVIAHAVVADGAISNYFAPGSTVTLRAYAVDGKTRAVLTAKAVRYFYVKIPNQPNVKMTYTPTSPLANGRYVWTGSWKVPENYTLGQVDYKVLVQTTSKLRGSFVQLPIATAFLTISKTPQLPAAPGPRPTPTTNEAKAAIALYSDAVNGTRPAGAKPRPIGCTQTNVFKRGEQLVVRTWGYDLEAGGVLSMDNVLEATATVPGQPNVVLSWGGHGVTGTKVWFWAAAWNIPADYALGDLNLRVTFKLVNGKVGTIDYPVTIIP